MKTELRVMGLILAATAVAAAEMRTWTFEGSGRTMEGEVAGFTGTAVTLKGVDGKTVSVPIAYLSRSDRTYLAREQAKQWKEVEVVKLQSVESAGRYKKCTVHGASVSGEVYIELLPRSVEAILQERNRQAGPIADLSAQIESQNQVVQEAKAAAPTKGSRNRAYRRAAAAQRSQANVEASNLNALQANLAKLQKAYDDSVQKTKSQTVVRMRNTGIVYKKLPVWECFEPQKSQPR
jgi:hypothetical protein